MEVVVVAHSALWSEMFAAEARKLEEVFGRNAVAIHHIGSTAVPGIHAKPVIDVLIEVPDLALVDAREDAMVSMGYQAKGAFGIEGRRYFRKDDASGTRTHHVHVFQTGSPDIDRHLVFRDYLRAHPQIARQYSDLKVALARKHPNDIEAYMDGKDSLVKAVERDALAWSQART